MGSQSTASRARIIADTFDMRRARMLARANLGIDPGSAAWLDNRLGSIFGDLEIPAALELDEALDSVELVARAAIPLNAFGELLDDWAESVGLERRDAAQAGGFVTFGGDNGTTINPGQRVTTAPAAADADPVAFEVITGGDVAGGVAELEIRAVSAGAAGNVATGAISQLAAGIPGITSVTNEEPTTGGSDIEEDDALLPRVLDALAGPLGNGTKADYRRLLLGRPGVGFVTVIRAARGPGTVDVYVTDLNNDPLAPAALADLQAWLDPVGGEGEGEAPLEHDVLVLTPTGTAVDVVTDAVYASGYSADGASGTLAVGDKVEAAIRAYVNGLGVGDDVVRVHLIRAIASVRGVANITTLTINGSGAGDLAIAADHTAIADDVTVT